MFISISMGLMLRFFLCPTLMTNGHNFESLITLFNCNFTARIISLLLLTVAVSAVIGILGNLTTVYMFMYIVQHSCKSKLSAF